VHEYRHAIDNHSHSRIPVVLIHKVRVARYSINDFGSYEILSTMLLLVISFLTGLPVFKVLGVQLVVRLMSVAVIRSLGY